MKRVGFQMALSPVIRFQWCIFFFFTTNILGDVPEIKLSRYFAIHEMQIRWCSRWISSPVIRLLYKILNGARTIIHAFYKILTFFFSFLGKFCKAVDHTEAEKDEEWIFQSTPKLKSRWSILVYGCDSADENFWKRTDHLFQINRGKLESYDDFGHCILRRRKKKYKTKFNLI